MDKSRLPGLEARSKMFLRSNSFQKLCSLAHPMRLKGFKSNKEALKSVFESLIVTTRGVFQSVTYRILCFLFLTPFSKLVSEPLGLAAAGKDDRFKTVRLFLKLTLSMIISTDKSELKCDNGRFDCSTEDEPVGRMADCVDAGVQTDPPASSESEDPLAVDQFFDCKEDSHSEVPARPSSEELLHRLREQSPLTTCSDPEEANRSQLSLRLTVYACILGCFLQLSALAYLLNVATSIPPGLVFLISALGYMGFVMMRITFHEHSSLTKRGTDPVHTKVVSTTTTSMTVALVKKGPRKESAKGIHPILAAVSKQVASILQSKRMMMVPVPVSNDRMSRCDMAPRSRSRPSAPMLISTGDKTISKIKLL